MANEQTGSEILVMNENGTAEEHIRIQAIVVPDAWHAIMRAPEPDQQILLDVWHLANDLKKHVQAYLIK